MLTIQDWLAGKKTYIMGAIIALDAGGAYLGYWEANRLRFVFEEVLALFALRAGVPK